MRRLPLVVVLMSVFGLAAPMSLTSAAPPMALSLPVYCRLSPTFTVAQVIWVDAYGSRQTTWLCARVPGGRYVVQKGPYAGHVGRSGVAAAGAKREGDGKTPSGSYPMRGGFGIYPNPGLASSWRVTTSRDVWVDDPRSSLYNTHQQTPVNGRWASAEAMRTVPAYRYAQVIGYNETQRPWRGSAIFLHVDQARPTAGCVSLPMASLLAVMRWQQRGAWIWITR